MPDPAPIDVDSLTDKILAKLGRKRAPVEDDGDDDPPARGNGHDANYRIRQLNDEKKALRAELAELRGEVETLVKGHKAALVAKDQALVEQAQQIARTHQEDLGLVDAGFNDPKGRKALRDAWEDEPKETRGKSPLEWAKKLATDQAAHVADPKANPTAPVIPKTIALYLPTPEAPAGKTAAPQSGAKSPPGPKRVEPSNDPLAGVVQDKGVDEFFASLARRGAEQG